MNEGGLKAVAKVYTNHKKALIQLMNQYDAGITKETSHSAIILDLKYLIDNSQEFCEDLDALMIEKKIITPDYDWNNAMDPITAIAETVGSIFGGISGMVTTKRQQELEEDRFMYEMIKAQNKSNTNTILIISGITFVGIGLALYFILKRKK